MNTQMFEKFDNKPEDYIPNNTVPCRPKNRGIRDIIRGTTPEHFITLPFNIFNDIDKLTVTYKQGITVKVKKNLNTVNYTTAKPHTISYQLTEEETNRFAAIPNTPVEVQIKVLLKNGDVYASNIYLIKCLDVLDHDVMDNTLHSRAGDVEIVDWDTEELMYIIPYDSEYFE